MAEVRIELANLSGAPLDGVAAELTWLGEVRTARLADDGRADGDIPHDDIWVGRADGDPVRLLPVRMLVSRAGGAPTEVGASIEPIDVDGARLVFELVTTGEGLHSARVAAPWLGRPRPHSEVERIAIGGTWTILVLLIIAFYARNSVRP